AAGIEIIDHAVVVDTRGTQRVRAVQVAALTAAGERVTRPARTIACGVVVLSGGWSPVVHLHAQSGGRPRYDRLRACFVPGESVQDERSAGACNGSFQLHECVGEGLAAGAE